MNSAKVNSEIRVVFYNQNSYQIRAQIGIPSVAGHIDRSRVPLKWANPLH